MPIARTHTQTAFDGVRIAWHLVGVVPEVSQRLSIRSIDGVVRQRSSTVRQSAVRSASTRTVRTSPAAVMTSALHTWVRSMDGVRMQPRFQ